MRVTALTAAAVVALVAGSPAAAQTWTAQQASENWDAAAVAQWDSGVAMTARCQDSDFRLLVELVAPLEGPAATMTYAFDGGPGMTRLSALAPDGEAVFARHPADFARALLSARSLEMSVSDGETPQQRYVLEAPAEAAVLGEVLAACGEPLALRPTEPVADSAEPVELASQTEIIDLYPRRALRRRISGMATVECIVMTDGRLDDCLAAREEPEGEGFGDATIAAARRGYRIHPYTRDGDRFPAGSAVSITLRWGPY